MRSGQSFEEFTRLLLGAGLWRLGSRIGRSIWKRPILLTSRVGKAVAAAGAVIIGLAALVGLLFAFITIGAKFDWRIRRVRTLPSQLDAIRNEHPFETVYAVADRAAFAERLVYWRAGYAPFERYPILGVGLGNAGFFFPEGVPSYGHQLVEIQKALDPLDENFPNPKNLWIRILSETGFLGLAAFLTWMVVLGFAAYALIAREQKMHRLLGIAGLLGLTAWIIEGLSLDTFALPQAWVLCGLLTAQMASINHQRSVEARRTSQLVESEEAALTMHVSLSGSMSS